MRIANFSDWAHQLQNKKMDHFWASFAELFEKYFRVEIKGLERIPKKGPALIIPNHSGYSGFDAIILAHLIYTRIGRFPRILAHPAYFDWSESLRSLSLSFGLRRACLEEGIRVLRNGNLLILFPEGESGNFKASSQKYHLQKFHTGFLRMAYATQTPVIPCTIIGAEESFLNLGNIDLSHYVNRLKIPLPLNFFPLPAKWKIQFLNPLKLNNTHPLKSDDPQQAEQTCQSIRELLQKNIDQELKKRQYVYFPHF